MLWYVFLNPEFPSCWTEVHLRAGVDLRELGYILVLYITYTPQFFITYSIPYSLTVQYTTLPMISFPPCLYIFLHFFYFSLWTSWNVWNGHQPLSSFPTPLPKPTNIWAPNQDIKYHASESIDLRCTATVKPVLRGTTGVEQNRQTYLKCIVVIFHQNITPTLHTSANYALSQF